MNLSRQLIQINEYLLTGSADAYVEAISALARRTETDGDPGVLTYHFYVNREEGTAGATIVYDAAAWVRHHNLAYGWEDMGALQSTVALQRLTIFGPVNDELGAWNRQGRALVHPLRHVGVGLHTSMTI